MTKFKEERIASLDNIIYLPSNIAYIRKSNFQTQEQFGKLFGYKGNSITGWEKGIRYPDIIDLAKMSGILGYSVDELLFKDLTNDKSPRLVVPRADFVTPSVKNDFYNDIFRNIPEETIQNLTNEQKDTIRKTIELMCR